MSETGASPSGLWERKKLQAMLDIQRVALDLFDEHGYTNVTVERVAAAASVSPSSIYRYFGTKEMLVLYDVYDEQIVNVFASIDVEPVDVDQFLRFVRQFASTLITVADTDEARIRQRMKFVAKEPEIKRGHTWQAVEMETTIRQAVAHRLGRAADDTQVWVVVAAAVWGFVAAVNSWVETPDRSLRDVMLEAVDLIIRGVRAQLCLPPE